MARVAFKRVRSGGLVHITNDLARDRIDGLFDQAQDLIDQDGVDLVVLCARRLACLYQVLIKNGRSPLRDALVVSDRFLETVDRWEWKNVLVLDDTVILGTTLHSVHCDITRRMREARLTPRVRSAAVCVDSQKNAGYLLDRIDLVPGALELSSDEVETFSTDVVTTLFQNGVPFFSDFLPTRGLRTSNDVVLEHLSSPAWRLVDVTAPVISSPDRSAYVHLPSRETTRAVLTQLDPRVARLVETFKVRTYVSRASDDGVDVNVVPIAMISAATDEDLDDALSGLADTVGSKTPVAAWEALAGTSKHRLVQMCASWAVLGITFAGRIRSVLGEETGWADPEALRLNFGPDADVVASFLASLAVTLNSAGSEHPELPLTHASRTPRTSELLYDDELRNLLWELRELIEVARESEESPDSGKMTKFGLVAAHAITSVFGYVSEAFEAPQQQRIRDLGEFEVYEAEYLADPSRRVLNRTITMRELAESLLNDVAQPNDWDRSMISLGIDIGNDLGIVVPTTQFDGTRGLYYRAYRLGETAGLAGRPLSQWNPSGGAEDLDVFLRWAAQSGKMLSTNVSVTLPAPAPSRRRPSPTAALEKRLAEMSSVLLLERVKEKALPGRAVGRFEGSITEVDRDHETFFVELLDADTQVPSTAQMRFQQVDEAQHDWIQRGTSLRWTIFESAAPGFKDRISRLRLNAPRPIDADALAATESEFSFLAGPE